VSRYFWSRAVASLIGRIPHVTRVACVSLVVAGLLLPGGATQAVTENGPDFNGDGALDLAVSDMAGGVLVRYGGGNSYEILREPGTDTAADDASAFGAALAAGDFNADGYDDLAVGDHREDSAANLSVDAGAFFVFLGSATGMLTDETSSPVQVTTYVQGWDGIPGAAEESDFFGSALAAGDLTGDGVDDLVVGSNGEAIGSVVWAGAITIVPGRAGESLDSTNSRAISQNTSGVPGVAEEGDSFGSALAISDVTGDHRPDLVVSAMGENGRGMVYAFRGTATAAGPTVTGATYVTGNALGIAASSWASIDPDWTGSDALFGASLAVGDVTGDGIGDVVAGARMAKIGKAQDAGAIAVLRGSSTGLSSTRAQVTSQATTGVAGANEKRDEWGNAVAVGDLTGDGRPEVIVTAAGETLDSTKYAGGYTVLRATSTGVTGTGSFGVTQGTANVPDSSEEADCLGWTVDLQDLNGDGRQDVVITSPFEAVGDDPPNDSSAGDGPSGTVDLLLSSATGRPATGSSRITGRQFSDARGSLHMLGSTLVTGGRPRTA
jgi:hypothetical protein